jgi:release factor glutamine methyltransferase
MVAIGQALAEAAQRLERAGVTDAEREALWLLAHLFAISVGTLKTRRSDLLPGEMAAPFEALVARRAKREPLQYILGTAEFMGLSFQVSPAVLIPRLDTETLVREAVARVQGPARIADIGTGSGAIAIAMAKLLPEAAVVAVDISAQALAVAEQNARAIGVSDRIEFRLGDLVQPLFGERFDAILANPPYIGSTELERLDPEVRQFEPHLALTPGPDGLRFYRRLVDEALSLLKPESFLGVEVGWDQARQVADLFTAAGLQAQIYADTASIERAVFGFYK